ncbi:hypothetical protein [Pedobacter gandavensis]|uniref:Uncharacterized protein n=1 Tax=Pedobacter gandavensis TaxID=2679963 RepID=A0ABR6ESN2_9SPHI|nr:hypothetical protein [Pedobacter gandavensis]MBB2148270.1 hypothetical protein [Pedobacter gandavensis]
MEKSPFQQAEVAFDELSDLYDLPKMPEDLDRYEEYYESNGITDPRSLYEEAALLKFLEPNDDPRGVVLLAVYHVKHAIGVDLHHVFKKNSRKLPRNSRLGIKGEGINTFIVFIKDNESWYDLDCKVMLKLL